MITLVIFSGLPGTGKSSLAGRLARELHWPLLCIDDLAVQVPANAGPRFWDEKILSLLSLAEAQLELGLSVIVDSIFMGTDRLHAQELARHYQAAFRPVYCFLSDELLWQQRVTQRAGVPGSNAVASWETTRRQREFFRPWEQGTALFVDAVSPLEQNYATLLEFVTSADTHLNPLTVDRLLVKGSYHG
jgi:predicted kinase